MGAKKLVEKLKNRALIAIILEFKKVIYNLIIAELQ